MAWCQPRTSRSSPTASRRCWLPSGRIASRRCMAPCWWRIPTRSAGVLSRARSVAWASGSPLRKERRAGCRTRAVRQSPCWSRPSSARKPWISPCRRSCWRRVAMSSRSDARRVPSRTWRWCRPTPPPQISCSVWESSFAVATSTCVPVAASSSRPSVGSGRQGRARCATGRRTTSAQVGFYVRTLAPLARGTRAWVELAPPGHDRLVHLRVEVAWSRGAWPSSGGGPTPPGFGARLLADQCPPPDLQVYRAAYEALRRSEEGGYAHAA